jgi:hypothetical protein
MNDNLRRAYGTSLTDSGPFLARIVRHLDATYMGTLEVELLTETNISQADPSTRIRQVRYLNPFYGITSANLSATEGSQADTFDGTQKSYGMWMVPPDIGTTVVVIFIQGRPESGFWIGCVQDEFMNFMIPGIAATSLVEGVPDSEFPRVPVAEFNRLKKDGSTKNTSDPTKNLKPQHPFTKIFSIQGLLKDDCRGITSSSARREAPSMVFGVSTPGPIDRQPGAPTRNLMAGTSLREEFISRLGGTSLVMDDGDAQFLRKTSAADGPPVYASVEQQDIITDPLSVTRPHNELFRIRTRTGHQILLHNTEDLIYIGNSRGTAWVELTSDGKIDIFASDSVSLHTEADINFFADRDINFEAQRNINIKAGNEMRTHIVNNSSLVVGADQTIKIGGALHTTVTAKMKTTVGSDFELRSTGDNRLTTLGSTHLLSSKTHFETATKISMNATPATPATIATVPGVLTTHTLPSESSGTITSIMQRVPTHEPYPHHENLDPVRFKSLKTDREGASISETASGWNMYSTRTDTFEKLSKG